MKSTTSKSLLILSTLLFTLSIATPSALADTTASAHVTLVKERGDKDITTRVTALNAILNKITNSKKLSTSQKSTLETEIQDQVNGLSGLKSTLDADTDLTTARADFQKIFTQHFIFAFYVPRIERIIAADSEEDAADLLLSLEPKLAGYVSQAKNAGKDVTALQTSLDEMVAKATDAKTQAEQVISILMPLTAAGYPGNKTTVQSTATELKTGRTDLQTARTDAKSVVAGLKQLQIAIQ